ncbi:hypothetical protein SEA_EVAA_53 [Gordonia phage Evaa]|nr:hypothetical protein SEA_EVAA_53 [Gordonia phage Evaa]
MFDPMPELPTGDQLAGTVTTVREHYLADGEGFTAPRSVVVQATVRLKDPNALDVDTSRDTTLNYSTQRFRPQTLTFGIKYDPDWDTAPKIEDIRVRGPRLLKGDRLSTMENKDRRVSRYDGIPEWIEEITAAVADHLKAEIAALVKA